MGLHCFHFILLQLFMSLNAGLDIKRAYLVFLLILLKLFMSLNACLDIKWAYLVFLSYLCNYSCLLMHAQILKGLSLYSLYMFAIIHVP